MASNGCDVPLIGVTSYLEQCKFGLWDVPAAVIARTYVDAVVAAGGMPVLLPPVGRVNSWSFGTPDGSHAPVTMEASVHPTAMSDARRAWSTRGPRSFSANPRTDCIPPA